MTTATALHASVKGLSGAEKAAALIAAGYVTSRGTAAWTAFYEAVLAERLVESEDSETVENMLHYVTTYGGEFSPADLAEYWSEYKAQVEIDGGFSSVDAFCEEFGLTEIDYYSTYADMVNDYDQQIVDAYIREFSLDDIKYLPDSYQSSYKDEADFAEQYITDTGLVFPYYVVIDWQATWDQGLRYDFTFDDATGAVFHTNW